MKKFFYMAVAAIAALSSCSSDDAILNEGGQNETGVTTFIATIEGDNATRATYNATAKKAEWEENTDQISIDGKVYTAQTTGAKTTFSGSGVTKGADDKYHAYFPASLYNDGTPTLPATQTYTAGKFNMPMYAESSTTSLEFKNLCAVLAVTVTNADITTLKSIKVKADKALSGAFTVSGDKAVLSDASDNTKTVVLESSTPLTLDATGTTFYIAIPAQDYQYLNIYLSADGTNYKEAMATKKAAGLGYIARSTMYNINYEKNAVRLWASGPYFATMNIGATSVTDVGGYYSWGGNVNLYDKQETPTYKTGTAALTGDDDTATKLWGINWCMPKKTDFDNLKSTTNCPTKAWKTNYLGSGKNGELFTGTTGLSVFLPAAGSWKKNLGSYVLTNKNSIGGYWSSTPDGSNDAQYLQLADRSVIVTKDGGYYIGYTYYCGRSIGYSVRAVLK